MESSPTTALILILKNSLLCSSDKILKSITLFAALTIEWSLIIVFELIAENPSIFAPPLKAAIYNASSKALFLDKRGAFSSITDLPVTSTNLTWALTGIGKSKNINIKKAIKCVHCAV